MTSLTPPAVHTAPSHALRGISLVMIGMIFFVVQDVTIARRLDLHSALAARQCPGAPVRVDLADREVGGGA